MVLFAVLQERLAVKTAFIRRFDEDALFGDIFLFDPDSSVKAAWEVMGLIFIIY